MRNIIVIFALLFNVTYANSITQNKPSHWSSLPSGNVEQPPMCGRLFMKLIPLSKKGRKYAGKYFAKVDDEDYDYVMKWNWSFNHGYAIRYSVAGEIIGKKSRRIYLHRYILGLTNHVSEVDHKDGDGLNNQKNNLRIVTHAQNICNRKIGANKKYKGVFKMKGRVMKVWLAQIYLNKKGYYLGYYDTQEEAALAYDEAAKKLHGEFASLNFKE